MRSPSLSVLCGAAVLAAALLASCAPGRPRRAEAVEPVVLVGVDGLEWRVVLDLVKRGRMPVVERLMRKGTFGYLTTLKRTLSPVIWTSVATGKRARAHGILGFTTRGARPRRLYTSADRKTKALWNVFSDAGRSVDCIGWWLTFPAEAIDGVMVAQTNTEGHIRPGGARVPWKGSILEGLEGQVTPVELQNHVIEIARDVERELPRLTREIFGEIPADLPPASRRAWEQSQWSLRADLTYLRVARWLLGRSDPKPDLLMVYFGSPDVIGHRFWRQAHPDEFDSPPTPDEVAALGGLLADDYAWVDSAIGSLLEARGDDPTVLILSDHGMRAANQRKASWEKGGRSGDHAGGQPGILIVSGGHARRLKPATGPDPAATVPLDLPTLGSVLDIAPTVLALQGLPVGRDMDGTVLDGVLEDGFLERQPLSFVATHDTPGWRQAGPRAALPPEVEEQRKEQLRALGYIE